MNLLTGRDQSNAPVQYTRSTAEAMAALAGLSKLIHDPKQGCKFDRLRSVTTRRFNIPRASSGGSNRQNKNAKSASLRVKREMEINSTLSIHFILTMQPMNQFQNLYTDTDSL